MVAFLALHIPVTPKCLLWPTVKTQLKCRIIATWFTLFAEQKRVSEKEIQFYFIQVVSITSDPTIYKMDHPKFIVSNKKEEPISA